MTAAARLPASRAPQHPAAGRQVRALHLVPRHNLQPPTAPFVALIVGLLAAGLLGLLLLNTVIAEESFRVHALQQRGAALELRQQQLQRDIDGLESPNSLAARAQAIGMVPAVSPAFIRLSDGQVLGVPVAARSRPAVAVPAHSLAPRAAARTPTPPAPPAATAPFPAPSPVPSPRR